MTESDNPAPSTSPSRLGQSLLIALALALLASLVVAWWPRSGGIRPPGTYLAGGIACVVIGIGGAHFPVTGNPPGLGVVGAKWEASGGGNSLILEGRSPSPSSGTSGYENASILEFKSSASHPGDYDLHLIREENRRTNRFLDFFESLVRSRLASPSTPVAPPIPGYLHRVDNPEIENYFRIASTEPRLSALIGNGNYYTSATTPALPAPPGPRSAELLDLAEKLVAAHPGDLPVRILLLDALIRSGDLKSLQGCLSEWRNDFAEAETSAPLVHAAFAEAERQARGLALSAEGKNAYASLLQALARNTDLPTRLQLIGNLTSASELVPPQTLVGRDYSVMNYLEAQITGKLGVVEVSFQLLAGNREKARALALSLYRFGQMVEEHDNFLITRLIGIALRSVAAGGLETVALNSSTSASECEAFGRDLEMLALRERSIGSVNFTDDSPVPMPFSSTSLMANYEDAKIRHRVANTKFLLVQTANAVRHRLLADGQWPDAARKGSLAPLLVDGPPTDPFSPTSAPLSLLHDGTSDTLIVYSVGPDGKDDRGALEFDARRGTISGGDISIRIPRERTYPFPEGGVRAATAADLARLFPAGLPPDPFVRTKGMGLGIAQTTGPVYVYSYGPDVNQAEVAGAGASSDLPVIPYDPTNGTTSAGDLFLTIPAP